MATTGTSVLITAAAPSYADQLAGRKRKYLLMMSCRIPCLILAAVLHDTPWLALAVLAVSVPLPWVAVLIANDRPPRRAEQVSTFDRDLGQLDGSVHGVVEGSSDLPSTVSASRTDDLSPGQADTPPSGPDAATTTAASSSVG
jgi:hypothetical protein